MYELNLGLERLENLVEKFRYELNLDLERLENLVEKLCMN